MADQEPPRPPPLTGRCAPPPVKTKLTRNMLRFVEALKDPAFMEEIRKKTEEFQREYDNEQKLREAAEQEHGKAGEDGEETTIKKED